MNDDKQNNKNINNNKIDSIIIIAMIIKIIMKIFVIYNGNDFSVLITIYTDSSVNSHLLPANITDIDKKEEKKQL